MPLHTRARSRRRRLILGRVLLVIAAAMAVFWGVSGFVQMGCRWGQRDIKVTNGMLYVASDGRTAANGFYAELVSPSARGYRWLTASSRAARMNWNFGVMGYAEGFSWSVLYSVFALALWAPIVLTGAAGWFTVRWAGVEPEGRCDGCGYNRAGIGEDARCPECGAEAPARSPGETAR